MTIELKLVHIETGYNIILGQTHFIKTVDDIYEAIVNTNAEARFSVAFCEASQDKLIRFDGNDDEMKKIAIDIAKKVMAGHFFVIVLKNIYPVNILNSIKNVPEVVTLFCATQNPVDVIVADDNGRRGVLGVIDGSASDNVETNEHIKQRHDFLKKLNYKR